jgi:Ulp1 family protease
MQTLLPRLIGEDLQVVSASCPRQGNANDCGVYALAISALLTAGSCVPDKIDATLWRLTSLAMARNSTLRSVFEPEAVEFSEEHDEKLLTPVTDRSCSCGAAGRE